jgi:hypothetical protein
MAKAFLITFKPAVESANRGWPLQNLQRLVWRHLIGEQVIETWRFSNRLDARVGDRVFLMVQGQLGPAVIGYGRIAALAHPASESTGIPVLFEDLVDPTRKVLVAKERLNSISGGAKFWRTQSSGVLLPSGLLPI